MNSPVPRVSVLMPVFNSSAYLKEACSSILRQSFRDLELVVVDDGSTDGSAKLLRALAAQDSRVRLVVRENRGVIASRNELLSLAQGELIAWMDSDDVSMPERLSLQVARFEADPRLVCLGGAVLEIDPEGEPIGTVEYPREHDSIAEGMRRGGAMRFPATMMRRAVAVGVGGFREPFVGFEDFDFLLRLMEAGRLANLAEILIWYRQHPDNISRRLTSRWPVCRDAILALARERAASGRDRLQRGETLSLSFPIRSSSADTARWRSHDEWARQALAAGHMATARKHARKALGLAPHRLASWKLGARLLLTAIARARVSFCKPG